MSHPDSLYDPENSYEDDDMAIHDDNYDDFENFFGVNDDSFDDSMDGDAESALASAGWGTDEDYGYYGDDGVEDFQDYNDDGSYDD